VCELFTQDYQSQTKRSLGTLLLEPNQTCQIKTLIAATEAHHDPNINFLERGTSMESNKSKLIYILKHYFFEIQNPKLMDSGLLKYINYYFFIYIFD
jgi:hypothetical protein